MFVVHVVFLVLTIVAVDAREGRIGRRVQMAGDAVIPVVAVIAIVDRKIIIVVKSRRFPSCFRMAQGALGAKVVARFVGGVATDAVGRRVEVYAAGVTADTGCIYMRAVEREICRGVVLER